MLQRKTKWKFAEPEQVTSPWMDNAPGLSPIMKELLVQRGITSETEAKHFLTPDLNDLYRPDGLRNIEKAKERVHKGIANHEKILVFGDYDADGVSSTALMMKALKELGADCDMYIPNRFTEGYGPNEQAFTQAYNNGFQLIITVDTGIAAVHEASVAKELGIDLIITDHHEVQDELPDAFAIIHPKSSPEYAFKDLAGVGVAFKFAEYLLGYFPEHLLDLVAIGTIADLVPLVNENRILAYQGLQVLTSTENPGLKALKGRCKMDGNVSEDDIGFIIGPRLNAVGRLQDANMAVQLLLTDDFGEAFQLADEIEALNKERQQIVSTIVKEAEEMEPCLRDEGVIVVAKRGWNEGVLGIVASRLVRKYGRPAIVLSINPENTQAKGSARSIPAFDLFQNCMEIRHLFTRFGGHSQAAGMTLPLENVEKLREELTNSIKRQLTKKDYRQVTELSKTLEITDIDESLVNEIERLAPFGMDNPRPVFHLKETPTNARQIGNMNKHLKLQFRQNDALLDGIGFGFGDLYGYITPNTAVSLAGHVGINEWNGHRKAQIIIQDIGIDDWQLFDHRGKRQPDIVQYAKTAQHPLLISNQETSNMIPGMPDTRHISYGGYDVVGMELTDALFILDLPEDLDELKQIIQKSNPLNIHVCYSLHESLYMKAFPHRDDFKWYYALISRRKQLDLKKDIQVIMEAKNWTKDRIVFMSKVFFELEFVTINNGVVSYGQNPVKKDLSESRTYQQWLEQAEIEKLLYYSNYEQLKAWFSKCLDIAKKPEEELVYGL